jgi:hypothetical protein
MDYRVPRASDIPEYVLGTRSRRRPSTRSV